IVSAYGVRGWIKVQPHSPEAEALLHCKDWWLKAPAPQIRGAGAFVPARKAPVRSARRHGSTVVAQLEGISDRTEAETLKAHTVWVSRAQFPSEDEDEVYWVDLIGCRLYGQSESES